MTTHERWVTVFTGPLSSSLWIQSKLAEAGFATNVPRTNARDEGSRALSHEPRTVEIQVPITVAAAACALVDREIIAKSKRAPDAEPGSPESIGKRLAWWTVLVAPVGLALGLVYLWRVQRAGTRPLEHRRYLLTIGAAFVLTALYVLIQSGWLTSSIL